LHDRNEDAFLIDLVGVRAETAATDIHHVSRAGEVTDQGTVTETRGDDREIVKVAGALPRIIGDVDIALENVLRTDITDEVPDSLRHGVDVAGRAGDSLGNHLAAPVEDTG